MEPLKEYARRRNFSKTPEPSAKARAKKSRAKSGGRFIVQKHDATRLHYDFRLEIGGVLVSWAVTRGPSFDPADKRLAVRTEDHPLAYADFEGVIPKREYGGGTVMLWDRGRYKAEGDPAEGLKEGKLKLMLEGERMQGGWALVRMRSKKGEKRENWLLIKERDGEADPETDLNDFGTSVKSGRTMDAIAKAGDATWSSRSSSKSNGAKRPTPPKRTSAKTLPNAKLAAKGLPKFVAPQLATLVDRSPTGEDWLFEPKFDGYRLLIAANGKTARCYTRSGQDWTAKFQPIAAAAAALGLSSALIDGEAVVADQEGRSDFGALQRALGEDPGAISYFAFDCLVESGKGLTGLGNLERKERLEALLAQAGPPLYYTEHVTGDGDSVAASACRSGLEGVIAKRASAPYRSARVKSWLKIKCVKEQEFVIGGWSPSDRNRPFSSLLLGAWRDDEFVYAGRVGTGFDDDQLEDIAARLRRRARKTSPFAEVAPSVRRDARWVTPNLVAQVRYAEMTGEGRVRHGVFVGLREDKDAKEIRIERPAAPPDSESESETMTNDAENKDMKVAGVKLTNPGRVLFPEMGATKLELARYLERVAEPLLEHAADRPLSLVRCPQGHGAECFFQKHAGAAVGDEIGRVEIKEKGGKSKTYLYVKDVAGLVACAQIGALELHLWAARRDRLERPDRMVFDLDPAEDVAFAEVRRAAADLRDVLAEAGLEIFPMLTGGKGVHLVCPIERRLSWEAFAGFAKAFAKKMEDLDPDRFVATMSKARRKGRIFIDHLRNQRGSTAIAPFSPRARSGAPVAAPVSWSELARLDKASEFTLADIDAIERRAKVWRDYAKSAQRLTKAGAAKIGITLEEAA